MIECGGGWYVVCVYGCGVVIIAYITGAYTQVDAIGVLARIAHARAVIETVGAMAESRLACVYVRAAPSHGIGRSVQRTA